MGHFFSKTWCYGLTVAVGCTVLQGTAVLGGANAGPAATPLAVPEQSCFKIQKIEIEGVMLLQPARIAQVVKPYEKSCIGPDQINALLKGITSLYLQRGYITSRVYVPPQDLKTSGKLKLVAVEGFIEDIYVDGKKPKRRGEIATAFPFLKSKPLNMRDLETGVDQMNRLTSNKAKTNLLPGSKDGYSIINIENKATRPIWGRVTHNNYGADSTGHARTLANVNAESLLHLNELISFTYEHSGPDYPGGKDGHGKGTLYSGNISVPFGYFTGSVFGSHYHYKSKVPTKFNKAETKGRSREVGASLTWLMHRDQLSKTTLSATASYKDSDNYLMGSRLESGRRKHLVGGAAINHARQMFGGMWTFQLGYEPGSDLMGEPEVVDPDAEDLGFSKFTGQVSVYKPFKIANAPFDFSSVVSFQHAPGGLVGSQQMSLGGFGTVRGLREGVIYGNTGAFLRAEIIARGFTLQRQPISQFIEEIQPYVAFDYGWMKKHRRYEIDGGSLSGGSIGVRTGQGIIDLDFGYSRIFKTDAYVEDRDLFFMAVTTTF